MATIIIFYLLLLSPIVLSYTDESINLLVRSSETSDIQRYCIELAALPNNRTVDIKNFTWHSPYLSSSSVNACNISNLNNSLPSSFPLNTILILYEHTCTITEQAWNVQQQFGQQISLMIITNRTNTYYELTYNTTAMPVTIPVLMFLEDDFIEMNNKYNNLSNIQLSIDYPPDVSRKFRPAILLMFLLVLIVLLCGNFWAADEFKRIINKPNINTINQSSNLSTISFTSERTSLHIIHKRNSIIPSETTGIHETSENKEPAVIPVTCCLIALIVVFAVGWLLLLYFFPNVMIYILQVMFSIGSFSCLTTCFGRLSYFVPILRRFKTPSHQCHKPCVCRLGPLNMFTIFAMAISLTLVIIWYVYRQTDWAWILQNILGAAICITVISIYRVSNMRVITIILVIFFLYDIFFVFITPYIPIFQQSSPSNSSDATTTSQKPTSVMEQVALGIGANGETVPLLFSLPMFIPESEIDPCTTVRNGMLGFGDVILPGMLLTFCKIFDIASANRWPIYHIQSIISYFVGLSITYVALYLMDTAQPALLYIVPCLLISTIITSLCRRELKELYTGKRIELLLDETTQTPIPPVQNGEQQINGEVPQGDIFINMNDKTGVNNY